MCIRDSPASEARALAEHLRGCAACAAEGLRRVQQKRAVQAAGQRFMPDPAFRARIQDSIAARRPFFRSRRWLPILATAAVMLLAGALFLTLSGSQQPVSYTHLDVYKRQRHTWVRSGTRGARLRRPMISSAPRSPCTGSRRASPRRCATIGTIAGTRSVPALSLIHI